MSSIDEKKPLSIYFEQLRSDPEGKKLVDAFSKLSGVVEVVDSVELQGSWDWKSKKLGLSSAALAQPENGLVYLIFELYNSIQTSKFQEIALDENLSLEERVERVERLEHGSAMKAKEMGCRLLGSSAEFDFKYISESFPHYYLSQQLSGHSTRIAERWVKGGAEKYLETAVLKDLEEKGKNYLYALLFCHVRKKDEQAQLEQYNRILSALNQLATQDETCQKVLVIWASLESASGSSSSSLHD